MWIFSISFIPCHFHSGECACKHEAGKAVKDVRGVKGCWGFSSDLLLMLQYFNRKTFSCYFKLQADFSQVFSIECR